MTKIKSSKLELINCREIILDKLIESLAKISRNPIIMKDTKHKLKSYLFS